MKTTIELQDELFERAKRRAKQDATTLRALVERGLKMVLDSANNPAKAGPFRLLLAGPEEFDHAPNADINAWRDQTNAEGLNQFQLQTSERS